MYCVKKIKIIEVTKIYEMIKTK